MASSFLLDRPPELFASSRSRSSFSASFVNSHCRTPTGNFANLCPLLIHGTELAVISGERRTTALENGI
jgi:hypothetical protein